MLDMHPETKKGKQRCPFEKLRLRPSQVRALVAAATKELEQHKEDVDEIQIKGERA